MDAKSRLKASFLQTPSHRVSPGLKSPQTLRLDVVLMEGLVILTRWCLCLLYHMPLHPIWVGDHIQVPIGDIQLTLSDHLLAPIGSS
jgi:hypothetical protein